MPLSSIENSLIHDDQLQSAPSMHSLFGLTYICMYEQPIVMALLGHGNQHILDMSCLLAMTHLSSNSSWESFGIGLSTKPHLAP